MRKARHNRSLREYERDRRVTQESRIQSRRVTHGADNKVGRKINRRRLHRAHRRGGPVELVPTVKIGVCGRCGRYGLIGPTEEGDWRKRTCRGQVQPNPYNQRQRAGHDRSERCLPKKYWL